MRRGFGILGLVVTLVVIAAVGFFAYQVGYGDGFSQHVPEGSTATAVAPYPYYYGYGPHFFGFGWIFGLLFFLFFLWVIFRIAGFAMWGRRWGYGGGWHQFRDERMREWHDRVHSGQSESQSGSQSPPPPAPPTTA
jgi:hypothetical protein